MSRPSTLNSLERNQIVRLGAQKRELLRQASREAAAILVLANQMKKHLIRRENFLTAAHELSSLKLAKRFSTSADTIQKLIYRRNENDSAVQDLIVDIEKLD